MILSQAPATIPNFKTYNRFAECIYKDNSPTNYSSNFGSIDYNGQTETIDFFESTNANGAKTVSTHEHIYLFGITSEELFEMYFGLKKVTMDISASVGWEEWATGNSESYNETQTLVQWVEGEWNASEPFLKLPNLRACNFGNIPNRDGYAEKGTIKWFERGIAGGTNAGDATASLEWLNDSAYGKGLVLQPNVLCDMLDGAFYNMIYIDPDNIFYKWEEEQNNQTNNFRKYENIDVSINDGFQNRTVQMLAAIPKDTNSFNISISIDFDYWDFG